ncbi:MAG: LysR family transcriptional regulator [Deltaproteobacteria bacterium]|nr:MAG: LysR family transcriptional regulator [Deltaproteobacteria bacterium]
MDTLDSMRSFVRVVDTGGFSSAARELGLPKSTVSRQVSRLEDRLGVRLLNRTTRSLSLTDVGRAYYERSRRIVEDVDEAELAVTRLSDHPTGLLRVTAPLTFGQDFLGDPIASFLAANPDVDVEVDLSDRVVDLVDDGYDCAVRVGKLADSSMVARKLGPANIGLYASPAFLERHGTPSDEKDLRQLEVFQYSFSRSANATGVSTSRLRSNNGEVLREAAVAGLGVAQLPGFMAAPSVQKGELVPILPSLTSTGGVYVLYPHNRHLSAKVRAFVDHLVDCFTPEPPWEK